MEQLFGLARSESEERVSEERVSEERVSEERVTHVIKQAESTRRERGILAAVSRALERRVCWRTAPCSGGLPCAGFERGVVLGLSAYQIPRLMLIAQSAP